MADLIKRAKALLGLGEEPKPARRAPSKRPPSQWHAVSIVPGPRCCAAANNMLGKRFLSRSAPTLPLKDCDRPSCTCRYEHHDDRRKGPRRTREIGVSVDSLVEKDRRSPGRRGRRRSDP